MQVNEVMFAGYAGRDADVRDPKAGSKLASLRVCHTQKGKNGAADVSTWVNIKAFGFAAEDAARVKKGDNVIVKGSLSLSTWKGKDGTDKSELVIMAFALGVLERSERSHTP